MFLTSVMKLVAIIPLAGLVLRLGTDYAPRPRGEKRPADVIGAAVMLVRIVTGEIEDMRSAAAVFRAGLI